MDDVQVDISLYAPAWMLKKFSYGAELAEGFAAVKSGFRWDDPGNRILLFLFLYIIFVYRLSLTQRV